MGVETLATQGLKGDENAMFVMSRANRRNVELGGLSMTESEDSGEHAA